MTIQAILFDLDGTLLDYDMARDFIPIYLKELAAYLHDLVPPQQLVASILQTSETLVHGTGEQTNEAAFAATFYPMVGVAREVLEPRFQRFYAEVFPTLRALAPPRPEARRVIQTVFDLGYDVVIATNPHFPAVAVQERLAWADVADFPYRKVTAHENSHFVKPRLEYYTEILADIDCPPERAVMVGDDATDMVAGELGCVTYLVRSPATPPDGIEPPPAFEGTLAELEPLLRRWARG